VVGRGADPAWRPDSRLRVYASPGEVAPFEGDRATFDSAEILAYDAAADQIHLLTATPEIAEMEPAVAPDGKALAFSDWRDGTVYVAALAGGDAP
jgi:hypothetical protein